MTEKEYIEEIKKLKRDPLIEIIVEGQVGVPLTLVQVAKDRKKEADRAARKEKDHNLRYDAVWCIFDVDDHPKLSDAKVMARDNGIELAISNPAFELWLLLHLSDSPGMQSRETITRALKKLIPSYDKHVSLQDFVDKDRTFKSAYADAVRRAKRLDEEARLDDEEHRNPTTGVYRLTETILN